MTESKNNQGDEEQLVLDWDDAVDSWGKGLDNEAKAEAAPFPARIDVRAKEADGRTLNVFERPTLPPGGLATDPVPPPMGEPDHGETTPVRHSLTPHDGRPRMYRPPTSEELRALGTPKPRPAPKGPVDANETSPHIALDPFGLAGDPDDGDDVDATQIASIPRELIESLARADASERELATGGISRGSAEDSLSISLDDLDVEVPAGPRDTDPTQLAEAEGSGVFAPQSVRPPRPDQSGASRRPRAPLSEPPEDPTRIVDLAAEGIELPVRTRPPPPPVEPPPRSVPPPLPRTEHSVLHNLDELAPPERPRSVPPSAAPAQAEDRGAATALRTVRSRKPRRETMPLTAPDDTGRRARLALLEALVQRSDETRLPALLTQAAELCEELGDRARARGFYERALAVDPHHVASLSALTRLSLGAGDHAQYVTHLEALSDLRVEPRTRALALAQLALLRWLVDFDLPAALRASTESARLARDDLGAALLAARLELACLAREADGSLTALAERTGDEPLSAVLLTLAARVREQRTDLGGALSAYRAAAARDERSVSARLGVARISRHGQDARVVSDALLEAARLVGPGQPAVALKRLAARLLGSAESGLHEAASLLADATDVVSLRTAAELARGTGELEDRALAAWAEHSHGAERALAQLAQAERAAERGDTAAEGEALSQAAKAAPELSLVAVVREMLARRRGDASALAEGAAADDAGQGPLTAAAKLAVDVEAVARELTWLERAHAAAIDPRCTETLLLDGYAEAGQREALRALMRVRLERAAPHARVTPLLALHDLARRHGDDDVRAELASAIEADPRNTLLSRTYARTDVAETQVAKAMQREAEHTSGARAAFAYLRAGFALGDEQEGRLAAFSAAYDAAPSYAPAVWALHHEARRVGDLERLHDLHAREAGRSRDPHETVAHLVRAALVRAGSDTDAAALQLARGLDLLPTDPVLRELVIRLGDAVPASLRAEAMQRMAEHAPPALERPALLSAAGAFEDASQPDRAAVLYGAVLHAAPHDPIADMGLERASLAAGRAQELLATKRAALEEAATPGAREKALEDLMLLDLTAAPELALERARQLLELAPDHPLALRRVELEAMRTGDAHGLFDTELRMLHASRGVRDRAARLRTLHVLTQLLGDEQALATFDTSISAQGTSAQDGAWFARQLLSSAAALGERRNIVRALELLIDHSGDPMERVTLTLQRADLRSDDEAQRLETQVLSAASQYDLHPLTNEVLGELQLALGDLRRAVQRFEQAAEVAVDPKRRARLWHQVGKLYQDHLQAPDRARDALRKAAEADLTYGDVQARLESLLTGRNDVEGLISLTETRLRTGGTPSEIAELNRQLGKLYERRGDSGAAQKALEDALAAEPENLGVLRDVARAHEAAGRHREAAESLIRLARLSRDPVELRETFFKLGEIYDLHLPDARRAEAAYRRVLKLGPRHVKALERLSALYRREGQRELSAEALERLLGAVDSPVRRREVAFELAKLKEDQGDARGAEEVLENLRRTAPEDLYVLRGLADFYRRNKAQTALAMHLNRAVNDLRNAVEADFDDAALWTALVEMLDEKQRRDAARAAASAAFALGLADAGVAQHTDNEGNIPGVGGAAFSELLDDLVFPDNVPPGVRILFRYGAEAMNRTAPFDVRLVGGEKLDKRHPLRAIVQEMARWVNTTDIEIYVTPQLPHAFVPVSDSPVQLLVGKTILDTLTRGEQQFLVARALKIARAQMSITCRIRPDEMALMLLALLKSQAPGFEPTGVDAAALDEMSRRIARHLTKRARDDLAPHLVELSAAADFDPARVYWLASSAGNRAGLLATGSLPSGLSSLAKLSGLGREGRPTATTVAQIEEARELLAFAISENHFEARQRAGADRR